jgi:hypothetical protein
MSSWWSGWLLVVVVVVVVVLLLLLFLLVVSNAGVGLLLLKSRGSLLECPSSLSSGLLRVEVFCLLEDKDAASSIIF